MMRCISPGLAGKSKDCNLLHAGDRRQFPPPDAAFIMKLHHDAITDRNVITGYTNDQVQINQVVYREKYFDLVKQAREETKVEILDEALKSAVEATTENTE